LAAAKIRLVYYCNFENMSLRSKISRKAQVNTETGLGVNSSYNTERFFDKRGDPHIRIKGNSFLDRFSIYQAMLKMPLIRFLSLIVTAYLLVNLFFAGIYFLVGLENLGGLDSRTQGGRFWEAFFFSAQTLSTVGYGHVYPTGFVANAVAAIESLLGLLMFAVATGLMYGRFSKPKAYILFSDNALFTPFRGSVALMFRMAPYKKHYLTDVEVKVTAGIRNNDNGVHKNEFFSLKLDIARANTLTLNWTIVHMIDEESPFFGLSEEEVLQLQPEMLVFVKGYDDEYSNTVVARTSYTYKEFVFGAKFEPMYYPAEDRRHTVMDLSKLNAHKPAALTGLVHSQNLTG
jgi:inward rectifier potassium channel